MELLNIDNLKGIYTKARNITTRTGEGMARHPMLTYLAITGTAIAINVIYNNLDTIINIFDNAIGKASADDLLKPNGVIRFLLEDGLSADQVDDRMRNIEVYGYNGNGGLEPLVRGKEEDFVFGAGSAGSRDFEVVILDHKTDPYRDYHIIYQGEGHTICDSQLEKGTYAINTAKESEQENMIKILGFVALPLTFIGGAISHRLGSKFLKRKKESKEN